MEDAALFAKGRGISGGSVLPPPKPGQQEQDRQRIADLADAQVSDVFDKAMAVAAAAKMLEHAPDRLEFGHIGRSLPDSRHVD